MILLRRAATLLAAALGSLPVTAPLADDPQLPRDARPGGIALVRRKEAASADAADAPAEAIPTLGTLVNLHTDEAVPLSDTEPTAERFSDLLADKALGARIDVAPALVEVLRSLARAHPGVRIDIVSGYRSEKRNEMMRKKGRHVASHSQHSLGHAVDFRVEGLGVGDLVREMEARRWDGGLGRYDGSGDRFVHVDVGPKRRWKGE